MKKIYIGMLLALLLTSVCLGACGKREIPESYPTAPSVPATETELPQTPPTLEDLLGEDYVQFLTDTITMQMENRMDKNPDVQYFPIKDKAPLSDYAAIGATTQFEVDAEGNLVIIFPAGTVASPEHGEQRFRVIQVASHTAAD